MAPDRTTIKSKLALLFLASAHVLLCQNAQLSGLVRDPSDLTVTGAEISLRNESTGGRRAAQSNESGLYSLPSLNPGIYRITIRATGFETVVREGVKLEVGDNLRLDFTLRIGDARTIVTVSDGPTLLNTEDASVGSVIDRTFIDRMPLNGRGLQSLIELSPGVTIVPVSPTTLGQFAVNGQRQDVNYYSIDGVSANFAAATVSSGAGSNNYGVNNGQLGAGNVPALGPLGTFSNLVSPDALQEFRIQTSSFAPEFGRSPGAQIGLVTRSGTNIYAGSLAYYLRNEVTDANDWFRNFNGMERPLRRFHDATIALGGPVRIPRLYEGRDRTFFFVSYQDVGLKVQRNGTSILTPTLQARRAASEVLAPFLSASPLPNRPGTGDPPGWGAFSMNVFEPQFQKTYGLRVDHTFSDRLSVFARYNYAPAEVNMIASGQNPANMRHFRINTQMFTAGLTQVMDARLVNEFRWNASLQTTREYADIDENLSGAKAPPESFLFPPGYSAAESGYFLLHGGPLGQGLSFDYGLQSRTQARQLHWVDNVSYATGTHRFKAGIDYRWYSPGYDPPNVFVVSLILDPDPQSVPNKTVTQSIGYGRTSNAVYRINNFSTYVQDTWRPNHHVTLTYGLRWDVNSAPRLTSGQAAAFSQLTNLLDLSNLTPLPAGRDLYPTQYSQVAPRLGLAWLMFDRPNRQTVLRIGGGSFFDTAQSGFAHVAQQAQSIDVRIDLPLGPLPEVTEARFIPGPHGIVAAPQYSAPRIYQWNATIEQLIGPQTISAAYVGARGKNLAGKAQYWQPGSTLDIVGSQFRSSYDALQLRYNRRLATRFNVLVSYTWSHSLDNHSFSMRPVRIEEFRFPDMSHASSDFDIRHSLSGAVLLNIPASRNGIARLLLKDWTASSIFFARSAPPTDVSLIDAFPYRRPDVIPGQPLYLYGDGYPGGRRTNPAAFSAPAEGPVHGTFGRNVIRLFGAWQMDISLERKIPVSKRASLQLRAEAFNVLNHPNFASPSMDSRYPQVDTLWGYFGQSMQTLGKNLGNMQVLGQLESGFQVGQPRAFQFALRLSF